MAISVRILSPNLTKRLQVAYRDVVSNWRGTLGPCSAGLASTPDGYIHVRVEFESVDHIACRAFVTKAR
ncbi:hypothetical protein AUC68_07480 [Methyloceanibacter methanicus]|uniref:Uncharacterized protein n=1 Tax=Methyloceanibacter methanicus TaxID=1774968 RepID=A0A1E3VZK6_9HYPH|nr:hypothetical protein [Methyloceanibacter methanicus]ODR98987.1 hypothetical protein AUC68_07480 [Methyloceanibacter methanicus]